MQGYNEPGPFTNFISDILLGIGGSASYSAIYIYIIHLIQENITSLLA